MAKTALVSPADLLVDEENPRISDPDKGQNEAIRALVAGNGEGDQNKFLNLALDIVENGIDESNLPIIIPSETVSKRYVVVEGNRRVSALKALENPDILDGALSSASLSRLRKLSQRYQAKPISTLNCLVLENRDAARHWIELRHNGEAEGRGTVQWGAQERARFGVRNDLALQILDTLVAEKAITAGERKKVRLTNLQRIVANRDARERLGVDLSDGKLVFTADKAQALKALAHVAGDIGSGRIKVRDIYNNERIGEYIRTLPANLIMTPLRASTGTSAKAPQKKAAKPAKKRTRAPKRDRDRLIPATVKVGTKGQRLLEIEDELRSLSLEKFPNAVSVLMRVFVELTVDSYIQRHKLALKSNETLGGKLSLVCEDLVGKKKLTRDQAKPVRRAAAKDSFLAPSIDLMHGYVHNPHIFPSGGDLRSSWDSLEFFLTTCWDA